jgi:uncharacterized protein (DUF305 family)
MRSTLARAAVISLLMLVVACSEGSAPEDDETAARSEIVQPGRPGEPMETLDPDTTLSSEPASLGDKLFVQMMVPHHAQALDMCELARTRASDEQVVAVARRIKGAQGPEILTLSSWLQSQGVEVPESMEDITGHEGHHGHDGHEMTMPGMLTDREMRELRSARGAEFDRLFLKRMIQHHEGAVVMADSELTTGREQMALEMAGEIEAGQSAEIQRLREILAQL